MKKIGWQRWAVWVTGLTAVILLAAAAVLLFLYAPWKTNLGVETGAFWLDAVVLIGAPVLGILIALRQPNNRYGWLWLGYGLASALISIGAAIFYTYGEQPSGYPMPIALLLWAYQPATELSIIFLPLIALWFPTGQPPTPRWRFLEWWLAIDLLLFVPEFFTTGINPNSTVAIINPLGLLPEKAASVTIPIGFFSLVLASFLAALSVFARYRRAGSVLRQQIKWFLLGGAGLISQFAVRLLTIDHVLVAKIYNVAMLALVYLTIGIAILRYRLYDIDVIIRKTLVYGAVTALLALIYFGSVVLLQGLFSSPGGERSPAAIVLSTLAIAALFNPLRRRVQEGVDRRFYRGKYNAGQTLETFAAIARNEVELERLSAALVGAVEETVRPDGVSLWLRGSRQ